MRWLLALALLAGCATYPLDERWAPLTEIREGAWVADGMITTILPAVYVRDVGEFLASCPPGSDLFELKMTHERVHARRELEQGVQFYVDYAAFPSRRWEEERLAFAAELAEARSRGLQIDEEWYARLMSERYASMIGYDQALAWVRKEMGR